MRKTRVALSLLGVAVLTFAASSPAVGEDGTPGSAPAESTKPEVASTLTDDFMASVITDGMSLELTDALAKLDSSELKPSLNGYEWDDANRRLIVHAHGDKERIKDYVAEILPVGEYTIAIDLFSSIELHAAAERVARAQSVDGVQVAYAGPKVDGSGIKVGLVSDLSSKTARLLESVIATTFALPFDVEVVAAQELVSADRQYHTQPYIGGAFISTPLSGGNYSTCSSGFSVVQPGVPTSTTGMMFASHCGAVGSIWGSGLYTNSPYFGTAKAVAASGADLKMLRGDVTYYGINFYGAYNSNSAIAIRGYSVPVVNQVICMNGSQSGTVCSNTITDGPMTINVNSGGTIVTHNYAYRSVQGFNISAAGNGDSGGPAFRIIDNQVYATSIISAISNGGSNCEGVPSSTTRKCSAEVWTAGLNAFFNNNLSWKILTY